MTPRSFSERWLRVAPGHLFRRQKHNRLTRAAFQGNKEDLKGVRSPNRGDAAGPRVFAGVVGRSDVVFYATCFPCRCRRLRRRSANRSLGGVSREFAARVGAQIPILVLPVSSSAARLSSGMFARRTNWRRQCNVASAGFAPNLCLPLTTSPMPSVDTAISDPSSISPPRICSATAFCNSFWMTRFSGLAP